MARTLISNREVTATAETEIAKNIFLVAPGVWRLKDSFVNIYALQNSSSDSWVLVDAGLKSSPAKIRRMAETIFGSAGSKPTAIVLTHGHFDHTGGLEELADEWGVPVYAHHMELPYLTGKSKYPPADPSVGGGLMSYVSFVFPRGPINVETHLRELPEDGNIPELSDWKWIHTPGHSFGHISLYRDKDGVLIAGDAVSTTNMASALAVLGQKKELHGPPTFLTPDWGASARSVKALTALQPQVVATGHGQTMYGPEVRRSLNKLARQFWDLGIPSSGRYVKEPALANEEGITYVPPKRTQYGLLAVIGISALALALAVVMVKRRNQVTY